MKVAVLTDTHWGVRGDNQSFYSYFEKCYEWFFSELKQRGITHVIHGGDLMDRRKYVNFVTLSEAHRIYFKPAEEMGLEQHLIVGNHDVPYKNSNEINSPELLFSHYKNVTVYSRPKEIVLDGTKILLMPWICTDTLEESSRLIQTSDASILLGHLELAGFEMYKGSPVAHGLNPKEFERFDLVGSGHFHTRSSGGNITYLGAFAEYTFGDYDDPRGFTILDTDELSFTFIQNPHRMFFKIFYDDANGEASLAEDVDPRGKFVKVIVKSKEDPYRFDRFMAQLEAMEPVDLQVVEDHRRLDLVDAEEEESEDVEDTLTMFQRQIHSMESVDRDALLSLAQELYAEALASE